MASITRRENANGSVSWKAQVRIEGYPARTSSHKTERAAKRWAATIEASMHEGRHFRGSAARRYTLADAIKRYSEEYPGKDAGQLKTWSDRIGTTRLHAVTPDLIAEVRGELARGHYQRSDPSSKRTSLANGDIPRQFKRAGTTVNRYLAALSHVFTVARKEWRWVSTNPVLDVSKLPEGKARDKVLTADERAALFAETSKDPTLHTFVVVALSTAARAGELIGLVWDDVDLTEGKLTFRDTKNGTTRSAWLVGEAKRLVSTLAEIKHEGTDPVFRNTSGRGKYQYHKLFKEAVKAAGISGLVFHGLRHTAASWLAGNGATEQQLRAIGGWKSNVVSRYVHLAAHDTRATVEKLAQRVFGDQKKPATTPTIRPQEHEPVPPLRGVIGQQ
jgi:integrase